MSVGSFVQSEPYSYLLVGNYRTNLCSQGVVQEQAEEAAHRV